MGFSRLPVIDMAATGRNIEKLRRKHGLKVAQVQEVFGFSTPQAIYKWERGATIPSLDNLVVLAALYECKIDDLIVLEKHQPEG